MTAPTVPEMKGGWIEWSGGENPVPGGRVDIRNRGGDRLREPPYFRQWEMHDLESETLRWAHQDRDTDVIAYRVVSAPLEGGEGQKALGSSSPKSEDTQPGASLTVVVPREPTEAMIEAGLCAYWPVSEFVEGPLTNGERTRRCWSAMIAATQQATGGEETDAAFALRHALDRLEQVLRHRDGNGPLPAVEAAIVMVKKALATQQAVSPPEGVEYRQALRDFNRMRDDGSLLIRRLSNSSSTTPASTEAMAFLLLSESQRCSRATRASRRTATPPSPKQTPSSPLLQERQAVNSLAHSADYIGSIPGELVARLEVASARILPVAIHETPDYAEVTFGEAKAQAMTVEPDTFLALNELANLFAALRMNRGTPALEDVAAERRRQIEAEGWTPEHDDDHAGGQLAKAAACYAAGRTFEDTLPRWRREDGPKPRQPWMLWPWEMGWWKPKDRRSDLVRAGALIVAEIERLDRAADQ